MEAFLFYLFSGLSIASAFCVICLPNPTRTLLSLIVTMFSLAVLFVLLGAYFVAMVHLIVYGGAVLVLFLFVIMLQGIGARDIPLKERFRFPHMFFAFLISAGFLGIFIHLIRTTDFETAQGISGSVDTIGKVLFHKYLLPFELTSILLLLGVFAATALAKKDRS